MNKEPLVEERDAAEAGSTVLPRRRIGSFVDTIVAGTDETGVTVVGPSGQGVFFPDSTPKTKDKLVIQEHQSDVQAPPQSVPLQALYPQWEDGRGEAGMAIRLVGSALKDLEQAVDLSGDGNPQFFNALVLAETQLFQAVEKTRFNKSFEIVVHFCAWALKNAEFSERNSPSLAAMCAVLRELEESPFLNLHRSTDLVVTLEEQGWCGDSQVMRMFTDGMAALEASDLEPTATGNDGASSHTA